MDATAEIVAAGAVVARKGPGGTEILLVHRPKYDDWSFPKGKLDPAEHIVTAAVREVAEETGLDIRLGPPLGKRTYTVANGSHKLKDVHYWVGRVVGGSDVSSYRLNDEIDQVQWVPLDDAAARVTYDRDRATLEQFEDFRKKTYPLVVLRHSHARSRKTWAGDDRDRTLTEAGELQSDLLVPLLAAYGVARVVSSGSVRCRSTVSPYADVTKLDIEATDDLSEEGATSTTVRAQVTRLLDLKAPAVLCTHRPVLPWVFEALALDDRKLEQGGLFVAHHRRGKVVAVEQHDVPFH